MILSMVDLECVGLLVVVYGVFVCMFFFFFKQKTAYEWRISDWSSDVCSSDLIDVPREIDAMVGSDRDRDHAIGIVGGSHPRHGMSDPGEPQPARSHDRLLARKDSDIHTVLTAQDLEFGPQVGAGRALRRSRHFHDKSRRSEEHTSELQ